MSSSEDTRQKKKRKVSPTMSRKGEAKSEAGDDKIIRKRLLEVLRDNRDTVDQSTFSFRRIESEQLNALRLAVPQPPEIEKDDLKFGAEDSKLMRYDIPVDRLFLDLSCKPERFYVRKGYDELYDYMCELWRSKDRFRVVLLGNAGTGKSWFQVHALKRLMSCDKDNREFDFVIRQVASSFYVIDIDETKVYRWRILSEDLKEVANRMKRTLYFFEPGENDKISPLPLAVPSLSTLSPNIPRVHEYGKRFVTTLYFWPWSPGELWAVIKDSKLSISDEIFKDRYRLFGGILRHILGEVDKAEDEVKKRLKTVTLDTLTSISLNVDGNTEGKNVSGFLVCYDNSSILGSDRFAVKNLEYTSREVLEEIERKIGNLSDEVIMQNVLDHLNGIQIDISGKNLEEAAMKLLSCGNRLVWMRKEIGVNGAVWKRFLVSKKNIRASYRITKHFDNPGLLLAPTDTTFPVVDFVFSHRDDDEEPVRGFQCTWAESHGVAVDALITLRKKHMGISAEQMLEIYFVCPGREDAYASRNKNAYFVGALSPELETILSNTKLFVIRPKDSWKDQIGAYFSRPA